MYEIVHQHHLQHCAAAQRCQPAAAAAHSCDWPDNITAWLLYSMQRSERYLSSRLCFLTSDLDAICVNECLLHAACSEPVQINMATTLRHATYDACRQSLGIITTNRMTAPS